MIWIVSYDKYHYSQFESLAEIFLHNFVLECALDDVYQLSVTLIYLIDFPCY